MPRNLRAVAPACALAALLLPLPARASTTTESVHITRSSGTCPASIAIVVMSKEYAGGAMFDYVAQTMKPAYGAELVSATPKRVVFDAQLIPAYASCEGSGTSRQFSFALHKGKLTFTLTSGKGPDNVYPGLIDVGVVKGLPHVNLAVPD